MIQNTLSILSLILIFGLYIKVPTTNTVTQEQVIAATYACRNHDGPKQFFETKENRFSVLCNDGYKKDDLIPKQQRNTSIHSS